MNGNVSIIYFGDFIAVPVVLYKSAHVHALYMAADIQYLHIYYKYMMCTYYYYILSSTQANMS